MALTLEQMLKQRREKVDSEAASGVRAGKIPSGDSQIRLLPSWRENGDPTFFHEFGQHYIKKDGKVAAVATCAKNTFERDCLICDQVFEAIGHAKANPHLFTEEQVSELEDMRGSRRIVMNVIIRGQNDDKPQLIEMAKGTFDNDILPILEEYGDILLNTEGGQDLTVKRTGTGKNTRYSFNVTSPKKNVPNVDKALLAEQQDIDKWVAASTAADTNRAITALTGVAGIESAGGKVLSPPKTSGDGLDGLLEDDVLDGEIVEEIVHEDKSEPEAEEVKANGTDGAAGTVTTAAVDSSDLDALLDDL